MNIFDEALQFLFMADYLEIELLKDFALLIRHQYLTLALKNEVEFISGSAALDNKLVFLYFFVGHVAQRFRNCCVFQPTVSEERYFLDQRDDFVLLKSISLL